MTLSLAADNGRRVMQFVRRFIVQRPTLLLALALLALLVRAAVPAGWMPSTQDGAIAISVCSGEGRATMWLDKSGDVHKSDPGERDMRDSPCAFAAVGASLGAPAAEVQAHDRPKLGPALSITTAPVPGRGLAAPPPPPTGPPSLI